MDEFKRFELKLNTLFQSTFSSAITLFFRLGAWIDGLKSKQLEDIWCDGNEDNSSSKCVFITKKNFKNNSLCLRRLECTEEMLFICDSKFRYSKKNSLLKYLSFW